MKTWIKNGLISTAILFVVMHISRLLIFQLSFTKSFFWLIYKILSTYPLTFFGNLICSSGNTCLLTVTTGVSKTPYPGFLGTIILLIIYFLIGVIISFIIEKIKTKK